MDLASCTDAVPAALSMWAPAEEWAHCVWLTAHTLPTNKNLLIPAAAKQQPELAGIQDLRQMAKSSKSAQI